MLKKISKEQKGPSSTEVALGAVLSVILGVAVGAAYMVSRPVSKVTSIPKDAPASAIYYIEGSRDSGRSSSVEAKRKAFVGGESITVAEGELNALIGSVSAPEAPKPSGKPGDKGPPPPPASQKALDVGTLNARIRGGKIQFGDTVTLNLFGASFSVIVQASGTFARHGSSFEFDPETFYVGGCPMQRIPIVKDIAMKKLLFAQAVPDDLSAAWSKLADVSIEGSALHLKMP
jgi:hypothetical protein